MVTADRLSGRSKLQQCSLHKLYKIVFSNTISRPRSSALYSQPKLHHDELSVDPDVNFAPSASLSSSSASSLSHLSAMSSTSCIS
jgi:hypothetical protein